MERPELLIVCPQCNTRMIDWSIYQKGKDCTISCPNCSCTYPITGGIPNFCRNSTSKRLDPEQMSYWDEPPQFRAFNHPVVKSFGEQRIHVLQKMLDFSHIGSALDVGCGDGFSTYYMNKLVQNIYGVDRSLTMLSRHPLKNSGRLFQCDVRSLPFADNSFDFVYAWEVLHHISDPHTVIKEMKRVSRRFVLVIEPNRINPALFVFSLYDREHRWVLKYSRAFLQRLFKENDVTEKSSFTGGWIFPNKTPSFLLGLLISLPFSSPFSTSHWILGEKTGG